MADELLSTAPPSAELLSTAPPSAEKPSPPSPPPVAAVPETDTDDLKITQTISFKEESNIVSDLPDSQKKSLEELKTLILEALSKQEFSKKEELKEDKLPPPEENTSVEPPAPTPAEEASPTVVGGAETVDEEGTKTVEAIEETVVAVVAETAAEVIPAPRRAAAEEVSVWGIPIVGDERSDVVLLKFLRARDFKVKDALSMIKKTVRWRGEFGIEKLMEEEFGKEMEEKVVFMKGVDREGHPVCYNVYGEFRRKELYQRAFADEEKRERFLRWRIQVLEKSIRKLDFRPTGVSTIVQVNDLKNSPGPAKWELRQATKQALLLLQDNYPEFVAKQVFVNVPWWYLVVNKLISPFITQRTKSKFVFAGPSKSAETLFKYIAPEQVPSSYGGLLLDDDKDFTGSDPTADILIKPTSVQTVEFPVAEGRGVVVWEVSVVGWDVSYTAEFVPLEGYTAILQKKRKIGSGEEEVVSGSFEITAAGKVVVTVENQASKKKMMIYRWKIVNTGA